MIKNILAWIIVVLAVLVCVGFIVKIIIVSYGINHMNLVYILGVVIFYGLLLWAINRLISDWH